MTARCRRYVSPQMCRSSLEFAVAHWLEHPPSVVEGSGFNSHLELNDLLITGVLSSSVVMASDECLKGRGFNSHLELNCFS